MAAGPFDFDDDQLSPAERRHEFACGAVEGALTAATGHERCAGLFAIYLAASPRTRDSIFLETARRLGQGWEAIACIEGDSPQADATDQPERLRAEQLDDLIGRGDIERRLFDVENSVRIQRRRISTIMATYVERAHLPTGRFPSYCCQRCGEQIGWIGRAFQAVGLRLHTCRFQRADEADRATAEAVRSKVEAA